MNMLKCLGQILASLIYTPIYTGIIYTVTVLSTSWIITLSFWNMIIAFLIEGQLHVYQRYIENITNKYFSIIGVLIIE